MIRTLIIAWRDFKLTVLRPAFLIAMIGIPLLILLITGVAVMMAMNQTEPPLEGRVAVLSTDPALFEAVTIEFSEEQMARDRARQLREATERATDSISGGRGFGIGPGGPGTEVAAALQRGQVRLTMEPLPGADASALEALKPRVREGDLLAAALVGPELLSRPATDADPEAAPRLALLVAEEVHNDHTSLIERLLGQAVVRVRAERAGLAPDEVMALLRRPKVETRRILEDGQEAADSRGIREFRQMVPMMMFLLLWIASFTAGQHLLHATIEEKSSRVMEVLLSAVSPLQLMTGKIIGQGGVGLVIVLVYGSAGIAAMLALAAMHFIGWAELGLALVYFVMAYFMIATLMAAVGSAVSDLREANMLITPVMMVLMLLWGLWWPISHAPNGVLANVFSFIPPAVPFAMVLRLAADEAVPWWQVPATLVWGYLCVFGMLWAAGRIFRVGVLMYGKPPSLLELAKWVRYA
jgi:ABC-type Na+ efflux pump permease subunit